MAVFHPGTCFSCGNNKELFDMGKDQQTGGSYLLCNKCVSEIAAFTDHIPRKPAMREHDHLKAHIKELEEQLNRVPNLVEGLIDGVRNTVADFVLAVSSFYIRRFPHARSLIPRICHIASLK